MRTKIVPVVLMAAYLTSLLAAPLAAGAQQPEGKVWRIGFLTTLPSTEGIVLPAFRQGMRERGYVEGKNFSIEIR